MAPSIPIRFSDVNGNELNLGDIFADYMYRRDCIVYIGAGFSRAVGMPDWRGLVAYLISGPRKLLGYASESALQLLTTGDLTGAASILKASLSPKDLELALNHLFGFEAYQRCPADDRSVMDNRIDRLLRGHWAGIITTNYDRLIERGLDHLADEDWVANVQNHGDPKSMGHILSMISEHRIFFVKIHGSLSGSGLVLTTQDYNDVYLRSPHISAFLTAVFLRYHVVFIGCSMDDEVVRLRRRLFADFNGHLPCAFVLFADTPADKAKAKLLSDTCGIEGVFYNNQDGKYRGMNVFLDELSRMPKPPQAMLQVLKYPAVSDRVRRLTPGNRLLLALFLKHAAAHSSYTLTEIHEVVRSEEKVVRAICGDTDGTRIEHIIKSRLQNLAMQGLLVEVLQDSDEHRYEVSAKLNQQDREKVLRDLDL